jgi:hypothetical protein
MEEIKTIQTKMKLNKVLRGDEPGPGGAHHQYLILHIDGKYPHMGMMGMQITFQKGPRNEIGSSCGATDADLLEIVRDRLCAFQNGPYATEYNQEALEHIEAALHALNRRVEDRIARGVLGTSEK